MQDLPVTAVDIGVGIVLLSSAVLAYTRGFVHEVLSIGGWLGAIFAAVIGLPYLRPYARDLISSPTIADVAAGVVIFIVSLFLLSILSHALSARIKDSALGAPDRALGFFFGLARGAVIVVLAYAAAEWVWPPPKEDQPAWLTGARATPLMASGSTLLKSFIPPDMMQAEETLDEFARETQKMLESQKALREMLNVAPKGEAEAAPKEGSANKGYDQTSRQDMQRLIEGNQ